MDLLVATAVDPSLTCIHSRSLSSHPDVPSFPTSRFLLELPITIMLLSDFTILLSQFMILTGSDNSEYATACIAAAGGDLTIAVGHHRSKVEKLDAVTDEMVLQFLELTMSSSTAVAHDCLAGNNLAEAVALFNEMILSGYEEDDGNLGEHQIPNDNEGQDQSY